MFECNPIIDPKIRKIRKISRELTPMESDTSINVNKDDLQSDISINFNTEDWRDNLYSDKKDVPSSENETL